ncbi:penicillin-binding protein [Desulfosarcina ovata subsp. sediminis]|uniref:Penicillin-binding protein 1A n=1 Tax=Desulfosarcina ovata subsp. sediminis TaxID=885957 RepID=A0A5K7ZUV8_9BACT|nr:penicillin-binding protein 1A [Desulfosarcina ovata]BBO83988.1 penicillin-binding protein [Desulfosarcina ovata subsp. sediminis]
MKNRARRKPGATIGRLIKWSLALAFVLMLMGTAAMVGVYYYMSDGLPKISSLTDYRPPIITTVYSDDNRKIAEFYKERRIVVPLSKIPIQLQQAFIAAEDSRFYKHQGIDFFSIVRAFIKNLEAGAIVQGGSTITQQVTKSFLLTPERSYERKIKEAILAYRIDKTFTKEEILYLYLNQIYLGHGAYGVEAAAENYFGKSVSELNLAECAILAGLPQAPSRYSPFRHPERAKQRQIYVLNRMLEEGFIDNTQVTEAIDVKMDIKPRRNWYIEEVPIYTEHVRRYVEKKYGADALYTQGLKIYTAVNIEMQKAARREIEKGLRDLDRRQGYRGPESRLAVEAIEPFCEEQKALIKKSPLVEGNSVKGVVIDVDDSGGRATVRMGDARGMIPIDDIRWARKPNPKLAAYQDRVKKVSRVLATGDVILVRLNKKPNNGDLWDLSLDQVPDAQSALLCIEAETGLVKVMVGGRDFTESQFNRAVQSHRQPGSAFKPILYAAALDKGYTAATEIIDAPIVFDDEERDLTWKPKNYGKKFYGPTLLREALTKSRNVVSIKILQDIGVDYCIDYARKLGITSPLARDLSIALGSSGVTLLELVNAYAVFANQGYLIEPAFITKIEDRWGNVLEEMNPSRERVIEKSTAYIITSLMESVVKEGTGKRVRALNRPVAGKTGTTNDLQDAWFMGYTPQYITGVWVGHDINKTLGKGETGSRTASPIWLGFMQAVLKDKPVRVFPVPEGVVFAKIDARTGLLPIPESRDTIFECFKEGTEPTEYTKRPNSIVDAESFFKSDM